MIPEDGRVEIDAKIHAGYCKLPEPILASEANSVVDANGRVLTDEELSNVHGRSWEDVDVRYSSSAERLDSRS